MWTFVLFILLALNQEILPVRVLSRVASLNQMLDDFPLYKSFGLLCKEKRSKTLEDPRSCKQYMELYEELLKSSSETFQMFQKENRRDIGVTSEVKKGGMPERRRSLKPLKSIAGRRRARSEALRREKLYKQGLKSHKMHSKDIKGYDSSSEKTDLEKILFGI